MILSRQVRPTMALRRTQSATPSTPSTPSKPSFKEDGIDFAKKYGFHQLLKSPLPSPALPSIVPRHGKKPHPRKAQHALRVLVRVCMWMCGVSVLYWFASTVLTSSKLPSAYVSPDGQTYELAPDESIPLEARPVFVTDKRGKVKWTISFPSSLEFPLNPSDYANICQRADEISERLQGIKSDSVPKGGSFRYDHKDPNFIDVQKAEQDGLLPRTSKSTAESKHRHVALEAGKDFEVANQKLVKAASGQEFCKRSLTYVMETTDAGLGKTLMGLWMSYGLANEEGRAFFIDDTNWAYGKYTTFFQPPPLPSCNPPPPSHRLPCPHQARHLLVSASTIPWTFGRTFNAEYQDPHKPEPFRRQHIFSLLRTGHDALFHLADSGADYVASRTSELESEVRSKGGITIGLHVRHGDRHPWEFQYKESYIPPSKYIDAAHEMLSSHYNSTPSAADEASQASRILLASDDPDVYDFPDFSSPTIARAQSQIVLASKTTLDASAPKPLVSEDGFTKFVETNVGWEGGFYPQVFWGLGNAAKSSPPLTANSQKERERPSEQTMQLRELVARAYLLDLKILGQSDGIVCAVSSVGCRLLGVMVGWEGLRQGRWRNVDGGWGWVGIIDE